MKKLKLKSDYNFKEMGRRIQQRRKEMKLTQEELSALTGISVSMISSAERGSRHFSIEAFVAVCEVLKASPDYFLLGSLHGYNLPENIMDNLKLLRPDDVEFIMQSINLLIERNKEGNISEHYLEKLKNLKNSRKCGSFSYPLTIFHQSSLQCHRPCASSEDLRWLSSHRILLRSPSPYITSQSISCRCLLPVRTLP